MVDTAPTPFTEGVAAASKDNYLGDLAVVDILVRGYIGDVAEAMSRGDEDAVMRLATDMVEIFAGMRDDYAPIPDWHTSNRLGSHVAEHWNLEPGQALTTTLRAMFLLLAQRVADAIKAKAGVIDGDAGFMIDTAVEEATAALMGTWDIVFPAEEDEA